MRPSRASLHEVAAVLFEGLILFLGILVRDPLPAAHLLEGGEDVALFGAGGGEDALGVVLRLRQGEQHVLGGDVLVAEPVGLLVGDAEDLLRAAVHADLRAGRAGQTLQALLHEVAQVGKVDADLLQQRLNDALLLFQQRSQHVNGEDFGVVALLGNLLRPQHGLLRLDGELIESHSANHSFKGIGTLGVRTNAGPKPPPLAGRNRPSLGVTSAR